MFGILAKIAEHYIKMTERFPEKRIPLNQFLRLADYPLHEQADLYEKAVKGITPIKVHPNQRKRKS